MNAQARATQTLPPVVWLGEAPARLCDALRAQTDVTKASPARFAPSAGCALIACGADAPHALAVAAAHADAIARVVLIAPSGLDVCDGEALARLQAPVLALFGTRATEAPPDQADRWRAALPTCHPVLVYDVADPANERVEATLDVTRDFLARGAGFLVSQKDGRLFP